MSDKNDKDEAKVYLKNMSDFDITGNYYDEEGKNELSKQFKKLLFVDDPTVRKFLTKFFSEIKNIAKEFDLLGSDTEVEKTEEEMEKEKEKGEGEEEEETAEEKPEGEEAPAEEAPAEEAPAETPAEAPAVPVVPEGYIRRANDLVSDMLD
jgi:reverse gyrase